MNILNKFYLILLIITISFVGFKTWRLTEKINYKFGAFSSVPVSVRNLYLNDHRTEEFGNAISPDPNYFAWNNVTETYVDNFSIDFPDSLGIEYFDYTDSLFYKNTLPLNLESNKLLDYKKTKAPLIFTLGIGNNGWIKLWCTNEKIGTSLILNQQLKAIEPHSSDLYYERMLSKSQYIKRKFEDLDDSIQNNIKTKFYKNNYKDSVELINVDYLFGYFD